MNEEIKVGDKLLAKKSGQVFTVTIIAIENGWFGKKYWASWTVNSDIDGRYKITGKFRKRNLLFKS